METLISQLRTKCDAAGLGDVLDASSEAGSMSVSDLIDYLKNDAFNKRMDQIAGQQAITVDSLGNITVTEVKPDKAEKAEKVEQ